MAKAAEASGQDEVALEAFTQALERAKPSELFDGVPLDLAATEQKFRILMKLGDKARAAGKLPLAESRFDEAAATARADRDQLRSLLAKAEIQLERGAASGAVETLQGLLAVARLRSINVSLDDGRRSLRSDLFIADRLASILKAHGRQLYEPFEREAKTLFEQGRAAGDARQLEEVGRSFPVAEVVPESFLALGRLYESKKQPAEAARAYKRLLTVATDDLLRARDFSVRRARSRSSTCSFRPVMLMPSRSLGFL